MLLAALVSLTLLVSGCINLLSVSLTNGQVAGPNHVITATFQPTADLNDFRGVFAFRYPQGWEIVSVTYAGSHSGTATRSNNMINYYANDWEAKAADAGHNGHKDGYEWWVGYSAPFNWKTTDTVTVTITVNTHGVGGTFALDFVSGVTTNATPDTPANPADKVNWELGAIAAGAPGVRLDQAMTLQAFTDVSPGDPYYDAIQGMSQSRVINGYAVGATGTFEFRPNNPVWRAQFAKMIDGALAMAVNEAMTSPFTDLGPDNPADLYPHEYVAAAYAAGITQGITSTTFGPWNNISRAQVVTMVVRALQNRFPALLTPPPAEYQNTWGTGFSPTHGENARIAEYNGLLSGLPLAGAASDPWAAMPRGEVAQVLWNMMGMLP